MFSTHDYYSYFYILNTSHLLGSSLSLQSI